MELCEPYSEEEQKQDLILLRQKVKEASQLVGGSVCGLFDYNSPMAYQKNQSRCYLIMAHVEVDDIKVMISVYLRKNNYIYYISSYPEYNNNCGRAQVYYTGHSFREVINTISILRKEKYGL